MSTCPEKDLHSIYIDGEMPESFAREYEKHLVQCEKCRKEYEKLVHLSKVLKDDLCDFTVNDSYLDESFARLQTKLKYSKNTNFQNKKTLRLQTKWIVPFAAAAVFALILTPQGFKSKVNKIQDLKAIARSEIKPVNQNKIVVDGNLDQTMLQDALAVTEKSENSDLSSSFDFPYSQNQKVVLATSTVDFSDIDVFRPDFKNSPASVKIEIPDFYRIYHTQVENFETEK